MTSPFHDIRFPIDPAAPVKASLVRRTQVVALAGGQERRSSRWAGSRRIYDAGTALRSPDALHAVMAFFEERRGRLYAFRFHDRLDAKSCPPQQAPSPLDQRIGTGDGTRTQFLLVKAYGTLHAPYLRPITKPVTASVQIALDGIALTNGFSCNPLTGLVTFTTAPASGSVITAGYQFDVPVRFDTDELDLTFTPGANGKVPHVPMIEIL
jgi:uncharacterized protein (TIGR02217 family)